MAIPTTYSPKTFSQYCDRVLGHTAALVDWRPGQDDTSAGSYEEVLNETLFSMGISDVANIDSNNVYKFRVLARVQLWKHLAAAVAGDYSFSADGGSFSRDQVLGMAEKMLAIAQSDAAQFDPAYAVILDNVEYGNDPYADYDDELTQYIEDL